MYQKLTGSTVKGWLDLVGILFQPPSESEEDIFWDDDYERGSINAWLKKKYTGPYFYGGKLEHPETAKRDVEQFMDEFKMVDVREPFEDYMVRTEKDKEIKILRKAPLIDLTLEEMNLSIIGVFLLDDVGGLSGFADFLGTFYESEDKEERSELCTWSKSLGWSEKKIANKKIL